MNYRMYLEKMLKDINTRKAKKKDSFEFGGANFPTKLTKNFLSTFHKKDNLWVSLADESLFFTWDKGHAHINSVEKAKILAKGTN